MSFIERLSGETEDEKTMQQAKALEMQLTPSVCLREDDFADVYSRQEIQEDKGLVEKIKARFSNYQSAAEKKVGEFAKSISSAMERVIAAHGELRDWFGPECFLTKTTEYDDIINGVDFILEFDLENPDEIGVQDNYHKIALAADVTSSKDYSIVRDKMKKAQERTFDPNKSSIKYFDSQVEAFSKGKIDHIVHVVVGVEMKHSKEMIQETFRMTRLSKMFEKSEEQKKELKELNEKYTNHPAQIVFLKEILVQLENYIKQDEVNNIPELLDELNSLAAIIRHIIAEKENAGITDKELQEDETYRTIVRM